MSEDFAAHPRLFARPHHFQRLAQPLAMPDLKESARHVARMADEYARSPEFEYDEAHHNALLIRARLMQTRVVTLLVRWKQTGERRYRDAAVEHIRAMGRWTYWSWIAMRQGMEGPTAIYDLSYGENATTLAIAFDWLADELSGGERDDFVDIAATWVFPSFVQHTEGEKPAGWFGRPDSNWNTVCAGGAGMAALAFHEFDDRADAVLERAQVSIEPFMRSLDENDGGWTEGVGYWNYGMRYAFLFLLSWEAATGRAHPLLALDGVKATARFPLHLAPHGEACSFGDVNRWRPLGFHYLLAERLEDERLVDELLANPQATGLAWPNEAERLLFVPRRRRGEPAPGDRPFLKLYRHMDWAVMADRWPRPRMYLSIRGGTTEVPHGHRDLLSFHCVVGDELLLANATNREYLDTTFSPRRNDIWEIGPGAKNTLFINGVGIDTGSSVETSAVDRHGVPTIRMTGAEALGSMRDGPVAAFVGRLWLLLSQDAALVIDRVEMPAYGRVESRLHSPASVELGQARAAIQGDRQRAFLRFACDQPAVLLDAVDPLTTPAADRMTMIRWCTEQLHHAVTSATLISSREDAAVEIAAGDDDQSLVNVEAGGDRWTIAVDATLERLEVNPDRR